MTNKMSKEIDKNSIADSDRMEYYRDFKKNIQIRYLGDYRFKDIALRSLNKKLKPFNFSLSANNSKVIFYAETEVPPYNQSCLIEVKEYPKKIIPKQFCINVNDNFNNYIYLDSQSIGQKKYLCIFWSKHYNEIDPNIKNTVLYKYETDTSYFKNEAKNIIKTLSTVNKNFFNDLSIISNDMFEDLCLKNANYINPILVLNDYLPKNLTPSERNFLYQLLATYHSFIGNTDSAAFYTAKAFNKNYAQLNTNAANIIPAVKKVEELASTHKLLLFNEAHTDPRNRNFLRQTLSMLYKKGYKVLAVEGVSDSDTLLNSRKYPTVETGFYTREPVFALLLREALQMGFTVLPYDASPDCSACNDTIANCCFNLRDWEQAVNIKNIIEKYPNDKVVVFGGHDHIYKATPSGKLITMAMRLSQMGYDFASIDQVRGNFYYVNKDQTEYLSFNDNNKLPKDFTKISADAYIIPPYLKQNKNKVYDESYTLFLNGVKNINNQRLYIKIYKISEDLNNSPIPVLVTELKNNARQIQVDLPRDTYQAVVSSRNKEIYRTFFYKTHNKDSQIMVFIDN